MKRVFVAFSNCLFYSTVLPQHLDGFQIVLGKLVLLAKFEVYENVRHMLLQRKLASHWLDQDFGSHCAFVQEKSVEEEGSVRVKKK